MSLRRLSLVSLLLLVLSVSAFADKVKLGKLGQTLQDVKIYASQSPNARVFYTAKAFEYLVINPDRKAKWFKVLLQNGRNGYVWKEAVAELPYDVTADVTPTRTSPRGGSQTISSRGGSTVVERSLQYTGTPYVWGGNDMQNGVDCSGFVKNIFGTIGVSLPRTAADQVKVGKPITRLEDLQPGDRLYFWENKRGKIGHTGIYLGNGYFVHSSRGRGGVATDYLAQPKWLKILVAARR